MKLKTLRISEAVHTRLTEVADREGRKLNRLAEMLIARGLALPLGKQPAQPKGE
jgi:predicted HicB family RNase H-like nuclease